MTYVITRQTKRGLEIGQNKYTKEEAIKKAEELNKIGMKVKYMTIEEALGL